MGNADQLECNVNMRAEKVLLCQLMELGLPSTSREEALIAINKFARNLVQHRDDAELEAMAHVRS